MELNLPKEVIIKRIPRTGYFGITAFPKATASLGCEMSLTGAWKNGLTEEEEAYFEKKINVAPGTLGKHNNSFWSDIFNVKYPIKLNQTKATVLVLDTPINQMKYKVLLATSKVANSEIEKNNPIADYFIVDEEAKAKRESESFDYVWEAMELVLSLSPDEKRGALRLFGKKGVDGLSEAMLKSELTKELNKDPKLFVVTLKDKKLKTRMLIEELIEYRVLTKAGGYYKNGEDTIAASTEEVVEYFDDLKNQSVRLAMETRLKKNKKA